MREKLPARRRCENSTMRWMGMAIEVQLGFYDDGRIGEVFLSTTKSGTAIDTNCRDLALVTSIALQYGCPLKTIADAATRDGMGRPEGLAATLFQHIEEMMK